MLKRTGGFRGWHSPAGPQRALYREPPEAAKAPMPPPKPTGPIQSPTMSLEQWKGVSPLCESLAAKVAGRFTVQPPDYSQVQFHGMLDRKNVQGALGAVEKHLQMGVEQIREMLITGSGDLFYFSTARYPWTDTVPVFHVGRWLPVGETGQAVAAVEPPRAPTPTVVAPAIFRPAADKPRLTQDQWDVVADNLIHSLARQSEAERVAAKIELANIEEATFVGKARIVDFNATHKVIATHWDTLSDHNHIVCIVSDGSLYFLHEPKTMFGDAEAEIFRIGTWAKKGAAAVPAQAPAKAVQAPDVEPTTADRDRKFALLIDVRGKIRMDERYVRIKKSTGAVEALAKTRLGDLWSSLGTQPVKGGQRTADAGSHQFVLELGEDGNVYCYVAVKGRGTSQEVTPFLVGTYTWVSPPTPEVYYRPWEQGAGSSHETAAAISTMYRFRHSSAVNSGSGGNEAITARGKPPLTYGINPAAVDLEMISSLLEQLRRKRIDVNLDRAPVRFVARAPTHELSRALNACLYYSSYIGVEVGDICHQLYMAENRRLYYFAEDLAKEPGEEVFVYDVGTWDYADQSGPAKNSHIEGAGKNAAAPALVGHPPVMSAFNAPELAQDEWDTVEQLVGSLLLTRGAKDVVERHELVARDKIQFCEGLGMAPLDQAIIFDKMLGGVLYVACLAKDGNLYYIRIHDYLFGAVPQIFRVGTWVKRVGWPEPSQSAQGAGFDKFWKELCRERALRLQNGFSVQGGSNCD